jgi:hypothetical protein
MHARVIRSTFALALGVGCGEATSEDADTGSDDTSGGTPTTTSSTASSTASTTASPTTQATDATGSDGSSESTDPSDADTSGSTTSSIETTPTFVALADGGWTATSCDAGRTWTISSFSDEQGDHTQWTGFGGLAFGNDAFVAGLGWGGEGGHLLHSSDGRTWTDLPARSFVDEGTVVGYAIYTAGVAFDGTHFLAFSESVWRSVDGHDWQTHPISLPPGSEQLRQLRGFPDEGVLVASVESQSGNQHPAGNFVVVSEDGGTTWLEGTGFSSDCSNPIQHSGDIEMRGDVVLVGTRDLCRSPDRGATWVETNEPFATDIRDLGRTDDAFVALAGSRVHVSADGDAWTELGDVGIPGRAIAYAEGTFVVMGSMGTEAAYSDDGATWSPATLDGITGDVWVRDLWVADVAGACD